MRSQRARNRPPLRPLPHTLQILSLLLLPPPRLSPPAVPGISSRRRLRCAPDLSWSRVPATWPQPQLSACPPDHPGSGSPTLFISASLSGPRQRSQGSRRRLPGVGEIPDLVSAPLTASCPGPRPSLRVGRRCRRKRSPRGAGQPPPTVRPSCPRTRRC